MIASEYSSRYLLREGIMLVAGAWITAMCILLFLIHRANLGYMWIWVSILLAALWTAPIGLFYIGCQQVLRIKRIILPIFYPIISYLSVVIFFALAEVDIIELFKEPNFAGYSVLFLAPGLAALMINLLCRIIRRRSEAQQAAPSNR
jgi:hypothetical protein